jgi:hypothetical protein
MKPSLLLVALLAAIGLCACDRPPTTITPTPSVTVVPPAPPQNTSNPAGTTIVAVPVPGPPGPPGPQGDPGPQGKPGDTVVVPVPVPDNQKQQ